jgi:hypothetical protein
VIRRPRRQERRRKSEGWHVKTRQTTMITSLRSTVRGHPRHQEEFSPLPTCSPTWKSPRRKSPQRRRREGSRHYLHSTCGGSRRHRRIRLLRRPWCHGRTKLQRSNRRIRTRPQQRHPGPKRGAANCAEEMNGDTTYGSIAYLGNTFVATVSSNACATTICDSYLSTLCTVCSLLYFIYVKTPCADFRRKYKEEEEENCIN